MYQSRFTHPTSRSVSSQFLPLAQVECQIALAQEARYVNLVNLVHPPRTLYLRFILPKHSMSGLQFNRAR